MLLKEGRLAAEACLLLLFIVQLETEHLSAPVAPQSVLVYKVAIDKRPAEQRVRLNLKSGVCLQTERIKKLNDAAFDDKHEAELILDHQS